MSSSRLPSASLRDPSMAAKATNNNRSNDRQAGFRQERTNIQHQTMSAKKTSIYNQSNSFHQDRKKRNPFSSLLASRGNNNTKQTKLDRSNRVRKVGGNETSSTTTSLPEKLLQRNGNADETRSIRNTESSNLASTTSGTKPDPSAGFSDVGSDLLEFGASVEFHEDHRRHIHAETLEIEASNETTREAASKEERAEEQLKKDLGRSKAELQSLNQGAEDQFESAKTFWTLSKNLRGEMLSRIVEPTTKSMATNVRENKSPRSTLEQNMHPSTSHPITPDGRNHARNSESESSGSSNNEKSNPPASLNKDVLSKKASDAEKMLQVLKDETNSLEAIKAEIEDLKEKQAHLEESMQTQGLQESLERSKEDERRLHAEILQDRDTKETLIVDIHQIRESCGKKGQKCMDMEKVLSESKNFNTIEEGKLQQQAQTIQMNVDNLMQEKEQVMLKLELEKRNLEKASKEMESYNSFCKIREDSKREKEIRNERKNELLTRQAEAMRKLKEAQAKEEESLLRKQEAQKAMSVAEAMKTANEEMEATIILPGKAELARLSERKMNLAQQIAESSKNAEKEQGKHSETMAAKIREKKEAIAQIEKLTVEYGAKQEEIEATEKENKEFIQFHNEQIDLYASKTIKFAELQKAEREAYEQHLQTGKERWSEKLCRHVQEQERIFESNTFKLDVIKRGIKMLRDVETFEREAEHAD